MENSAAIGREQNQSNIGVSLLAILIVLLSVIVAGAALALISYERAHANRIVPGVQVLGVQLGDMTRDEARAALGQPIAELEGRLLTLRHGDRRWTASAAELGLRYDLEAMLDHAIEWGRGQGLLASAQERLGLRHSAHTVEPVVQADRVSALDYLYRLAKDIDVTMQNASLAINNLQVVTTPARTGYRLDVESSAARVAQMLTSGQVGDVQLTVATLLPQVTDQSIAEASQTAQRLISAPVAVTFSGRDWTLSNSAAKALDIARSWAIDRQQLAAAVVLDQKKTGDQVVVTARLDDSKFTSAFAAIAKDLNRKAQNARFDYNVQTGRLTPLQVSQEGRTVDVAENVKRLVAAAHSDNRTFQLAVAIAKPAVAVDQADKLGIREQVAQPGVTTFAGGTEARAHNIRLAASKLDGAMIAPGATFSLLDTLGPITAEAGYQEGFAIVGDSTVTDVGGGVCQVATTAFRAAFWAGLTIVERNPHRYLINRYFIKGGPHGLDAAIYDPGRDLQFKNNTNNYLIIKTDAGDPNNFTVAIYGTKPGWTVTMEEPVIKAGKAPGPRLPNIEDPTKPTSYSVQAQPSIAGESASITRVVKQGNTVLSRDTFNTTYQPASEQWIVGTKK